MAFDERCAQDFKTDFDFDFNAETCGTEWSCLHSAHYFEAAHSPTILEAMEDLKECIQKGWPGYLQQECGPREPGYKLCNCHRQSGEKCICGTPDDQQCCNADCGTCAELCADCKLSCKNFAFNVKSKYFIA